MLSGLVAGVEFNFYENLETDQGGFDFWKLPNFSCLNPVGGLDVFRSVGASRGFTRKTSFSSMSPRP